MMPISWWEDEGRLVVILLEGAQKHWLYILKKIYDFLKDTYIYVPNHSRICSSQFSFCIRVSTTVWEQHILGSWIFMRFNFS